jgi:hypothetical protein
MLKPEFFITLHPGPLPQLMRGFPDQQARQPQPEYLSQKKRFSLNAAILRVAHV